MTEMIKDSMIDKTDESIPNTPKQRQPDSMIQDILLKMYTTLRDDHSPDCLDCFYEQELRGYLLKSQVFYFLDGYRKRLGFKSRLNEPETKEDWQEFLFEIAERINEEADSLGVLEMMISEKYPGLIPLEHQIDGEELRDEQKAFAERQSEEIMGNIEANREQYAKVNSRNETAKGNLIEETAKELNKLVEIGTSQWELLLYSAISNYCPEIPVSGIKKRCTMHAILYGDISTGKTTVLKILETVAPKALYYTSTTRASFEGLVGADGIEDGVMDRVKDGALLIPEYNSCNIPYLREFLDNDHIRFAKGGKEKEGKPNTVVITGTNPKSDWWLNNMKLRAQIGEAEGDLSRFDVFLPMVVTKESNAKVVGDWKLFSNDKSEIDLDNIGGNLTDLSTDMAHIKGVNITPDQERTLKDTFMRHNKSLSGGPRPVLLVPRDMETLCRILNVVVISNFSNRKVNDGIVSVRKEDVEKAVELFETLISYREEVYSKSTREIYSLDDKILLKIIEAGGGKEVKTVDVEKVVVREDDRGNQITDNDGNPLGLCSRATYYRVLKKLILEKHLKKIGNKPMIVVPI